MSRPDPRCFPSRLQPLEQSELLRLLAVVVISCGVASCKSSPREERAPERGLKELAESGSFENSAARNKDERLFNRLSIASEDRGSPERKTTVLPPEQPSEQTSAVLLPVLSPTEFCNSELLALLRQRLEEKWDALGDSTESGSPEESVLRAKASVEIIALSFLGELMEEEADSTLEALEVAASESASETQLLLAEAYAIYSGKVTGTEEASHLVHSTLKEQAPEEVAPAPATVLFKVDRLSFAESITGPGQFTPLEKTLTPGGEVLIYGEFRDFQSVEEINKHQEVFYRREFAASLSLFSEAGEEIDGLEFLPRNRGRQLAASRAELMNFWALYKIPSDLKKGRYRIAVNAQDLISNCSAAAELWFDLPVRAQK